MIVDLSPELLVEMFRTDNVIHSVIVDGIPREYRLADVKVNQHGTIELWLESETDQTEDRKPILLKDLRGM
jgi:hypothetical protein